MEIRTEPYNLKIKDPNILLCPCCDIILKKILI